MARVDVIIPAFNAAHFLPGAIRSVIAQTEQDWRILLVDDGSTDNTRTVLAPFEQELGDRFTYIYQANAGLPAARNTAIRHSSSPLLALLDADDLWLPRRLEASLASFAGRPEIGLSYGLISRIDAAGEWIDTFAGNGAHSEGWIAPYIYMRKIELPCPSLTFRRDSLDVVGLFDETMRATEDRDLWLRIALRFQVAFVPEVIALYRSSPSSMSGDPDRMLRSQLQFIRKHYGSPGCGILTRQIALGRAYKQRAEALKSRGKPWAALGSSLHGLALAPLDKDNLRTSGSLLLAALGLR